MSQKSVPAVELNQKVGKLPTACRVSPDAISASKEVLQRVKATDKGCSSKTGCKTKRCSCKDHVVLAVNVKVAIIFT